jgi:hypothetical protein
MNAASARHIAICAVLAACLGASGCNRRDSTARYIPAEKTARDALVAGLDAWKGGAAAGEIAGTKPLVFVTDSYRNSKERLVGYEILGQVPGNVPRCFAVELRFEPPREEKTRYVIVGIDPLWVFRMEDYQLLAQWDHHMENEDPPARQPAEAAKEDK